MSRPVAQKYALKAKPKSPGRPSAKAGPKPDLLKLKDNWHSLMRKSLAKKKPPEGWPKQEG
jgi:hypothetical protein